MYTCDLVVGGTTYRSITLDVVDQRSAPVVLKKFTNGQLTHVVCKSTGVYPLPYLMWGDQKSVYRMKGQTHVEGYNITSTLAIKDYFDGTKTSLVDLVCYTNYHILTLKRNVESKNYIRVGLNEDKQVVLFSQGLNPDYLYEDLDQITGQVEPQSPSNHQVLIWSILGASILAVVVAVVYKYRHRLLAAGRSKRPFGKANHLFTG